MKFEGNHELPSLEFDEATGYMKISGYSVAMDDRDFWGPLTAKVEEYLEQPRDINLDIELEYFNTPSAKRLLHLLKIIDDKAKNAIVTWIDDDDEDMREAGEDYASMINKNIKWKFK